MDVSLGATWGPGLNVIRNRLVVPDHSQTYCSSQSEKNQYSWFLTLPALSIYRLIFCLNGRITWGPPGGHGSMLIHGHPVAADHPETHRSSLTSDSKIYPDSGPASNNRSDTNHDVANNNTLPCMSSTPQLGPTHRTPVIRVTAVSCGIAQLCCLLPSCRCKVIESYHSSSLWSLAIGGCWWYHPGSKGRARDEADC